MQYLKASGLPDSLYSPLCVHTFERSSRAFPLPSRVAMRGGQGQLCGRAQSRMSPLSGTSRTRVDACACESECACKPCVAPTDRIHVRMPLMALCSRPDRKDATRRKAGAPWTPLAAIAPLGMWQIPARVPHFVEFSSFRFWREGPTCVQMASPSPLPEPQGAHSRAPGSSPHRCRTADAANRAPPDAACIGGWWAYK